jgi:catechol 2,3-dioxygenase-like lactoylglutathione lyase family enzyme
MDFKLELVAVPVSDVDRAKAFYVEQAGFNADHDHVVNENLRFVQLTPPGSACSITIGTGIVDAAPGSLKGLQLVVSDIDAARAELEGRGVASATSRSSRGGGSCSSATPTATPGPCRRFPPATAPRTRARTPARRRAGVS